MHAKYNGTVLLMFNGFSSLQTLCTGAMVLPIDQQTLCTGVMVLPLDHPVYWRHGVTTRPPCVLAPWCYH
ncbi:hypothetical protein DPMN_077119 [Dreissena polymorpha]|uniref:Uncharacterized protein n=1 Tax=Dreissena polymorpha TaxID=45954 RepID=A0A9D3YKC2_DREPO|nr:hypothetical protein DPMN_077119 [Dreissena polymorpha]